ncbi:MAG: DUF481 domain-containing protein [Woeseiaceae bacterium]|nr:DUF481 domain-containing protein [Woeseiaceae bacterium]
MLRTASGAILALAFLCCAADARADVVTMANGDRITGEIKRVWDGELFIETAYADEFAVDLDAVAEIQSDREFEIELEDHSELTGRFGFDDLGGMEFVVGAQRIPLEPMGIAELNEPEEYFEWNLRSDLSFSASSGNSDTSNFLWQGDTGVKIGDHRHQLDLRFDRNDQDGLTTKEQYSGTYTYSWFFSDPWFLLTGVGYERDPIRQLTDRYTGGVGIGLQVFEDANRLLELTFGAVNVRERLAGVTNDSTTARWQLEYRRDITSDLEFFHDHGVLHYLTGRTNTVADTTTGFRWEVWGDVYMNAQIDWNWESDPAPGQEQEDLTYALGIGIELD